MHRTEGANNISNLFTDGPPATTVNDDWLNAIQEEIAYVIEQAGLTLKTKDTETLHQLKEALDAIIALLVDQDVSSNASPTHESVIFTPMTTVERNALPATNGRVICNTDVDQFQGYVNGVWVNLNGAFG